MKRRQTARHMVGTVAYALRRIAGMLDRADSSQTMLIRRAMTTHDMTSHPDETYYRNQYWYWLLQECVARFPDRSASAVDIGCGQGRLSLPLASWLRNGRLVGIDITPGAIERARSYAAASGVTNVEFHAADAVRFLQQVAPASFNIALCLEAVFFMPSYRQTIAAAEKALKPGGVIFISFRSQYYNLLHSLRDRNWQSAFLARDDREGYWGGGGCWFSWHTPADIVQLLSEAGFTDIKLRAIGTFSGIEGDPLATIAQPSRLSATEQDLLMDIEVSLAEQYQGCGRYILATATKPFTDSGSTKEELDR